MSDVRLRLLFCDNLSIPRGKYLQYKGNKDGCSRFCLSTFGVHYDKDLLDAPGAMMMEGLPDMEARYLGKDIRDCWEKKTKVVIGELYDHNGEPLELCGRAALKRAIEDWSKHGLYPKVGIEMEAFAFTQSSDGELTPYGTPGAVVYGTGAFTDPLRFTNAIWEKSHEIGFHLEMITAEYDSPQFEFTLRYDEALKAIDDMFLFRLMAREIALEYGVLLTFMPKPIPSAGGSGMHINFSFTENVGRNALSNGVIGGPRNLNKLGRGCLAGLMHHHQGLAGILAPTANSYARLQQGCLSGYWQNWGGDHRGVTARISMEGGEKARIEHRMADFTANPYIAVAAVLQASRLGYENGYELQPAETGDCFDHTDAKIRVAPDLRRAMKDLENDRELGEAVGRLIVDNLLFMKEKEFKKTKNLEGEELRDFYIFYI